MEKNIETLILFYNTMWNVPLDFSQEELPKGCGITTDRSLFSQADAVVFHLPDLESVMEEEIIKPDGQIWVAWSLECEKNYPWTQKEEFRNFFDLWMGYHQEDDIVYPYYEYSFVEQFRCASQVEKQENKACMFISSPFNQSQRQEYLYELMKYTPIDSYGGLFHNKTLSEDKGRETLFEVNANYKFVIGFENALAKDYVTEKFFNPLLAGTVPVYLGAPNIQEFAPGKDCFVDVTAFQNPRELADFMNTCYEDESLYSHLSKWRERPLLLDFKNKIEKVKTNPLIRLCLKIQELKSGRDGR